MTDYIEYNVRVYKSGSKFWYLNGKLHREDGPACEYTNGDKYWYLAGVEYTEKKYWEKVRGQESCNGKVVEIDGKKYQLKEI